MNFKEIENLAKLNKYNFIHLNSTKSTMLEAKKYLDKKNTNCIILSDEQTQGRGRRGNIWHSPKGNLYCSITFKNYLDKKEHFLFTVILAISIKLALKEFNAKNIYFKWPNDIFFKNKKFCGIISETHYTDQSNNFIISGIGINIKSSPHIEKNPTTYVEKFCQINSISDFFKVFLKILFLNLNYLILKKNNYLINQFKNSLMFLGDEINLKLNNDLIITGTFLDINSDGSIDVGDTVGIVAQILGNRHSTHDATSGKFIRNNNSLLLEANGYVGGIQMTLNHGADFQITLTEDAMLSDYNTVNNTTTLVIVKPESDELFTFNGNFKIIDVIAASNSGRIAIQPAEITLSDAYPNPFNPTTSMALNVTMAGHVSVEIYNLMGQLVATLQNGYLEANTHLTLEWDASDMTSGMYLVKAQTANYVTTQKLMFLK